jgi:hypothetical protein
MATNFEVYAFNTVAGGPDRTTAQRAGDVYNVRDWITNMGSASAIRAGIQAAIDYAQQGGAGDGYGGIIFFPPGQYDVDASVLIRGYPSGLRFVGSGGVVDGVRGSLIRGNFADYIIRTSGPSYVQSFEYLCVQNIGTFTINNSTVPAADDLTLWSSGTTYNSVYPAPGGQVYGSDGYYYNNMQSGNIGHDPTIAANQPTWWTNTFVNRNTQVAGGCIYSDSEFTRFVGCELQVNSGIGAYCTQNNVSFEGTAIKGHFPSAASGDSLATRAKSIGAVVINGSIRSSRWRDLGIAMCCWGSGSSLRAELMTNENCGTVGLIGMAPINFYDANDHAYKPASNYGTGASFIGVTCENCIGGFEVVGSLSCSGCSADARAASPVGEFAFKGGPYISLSGCTTSGHFTGTAWDLAGATGGCTISGCTATANDDDNKYNLPDLAGRDAVLRVTNSYASKGQAGTIIIFDGALLISQLPALPLYRRGTVMRCSNSSIAYSDTTVGQLLGTSTGSNNVEITWDGAAWRITGP